MHRGRELRILATMGLLALIFLYLMARIKYLLRVATTSPVASCDQLLAILPNFETVPLPCPRDPMPRVLQVPDQANLQVLDRILREDIHRRLLIWVAAP